MFSILKSFSVFTLVSLLTGFLSFMFLPILTSKLSPEGYGIIQLITSLNRVFVLFIGFGIPHVLMTKLFNIENKEEFKYYFSAFNFYSLLLTIIYVLILIIIYFFNLYTYKIGVNVIICAFFISFLTLFYETNITYYAFLKKLKVFSILSLSKYFLEFGLIFLLVVILERSWYGRIESIFFSLLILSIIILYFQFKQKILAKEFRFKKYWELLVRGMPLVLLNASILVFDISDRFFIDYMVNTGENGIYSVGYTISSIFLILSTSLISSIRPMIYADLSATNTSSSRTLGIYLLMVIIFFIGINLFDTFIYKWLVDIRYQKSINYIFPMTLGFLFWSIYNYYISHLLFFKKNRIIAYISVITIVLNLLLNYFFINMFSTIGACYATAVSSFFLMVISIILVKFVK